MKKGIKKLIAPMLAMMLLGAVGCSKQAEKAEFSRGSTQNSTMDVAKEPARNEGGLEYASEKQKSSLENESTSDRKVIRTVRKDIETKEFDKAVSFITESTNRDKGYIQSSSTSGGKVIDSSYVGNRYGEFVVRIPVDKLAVFLKDVETIGVVLSSSENGDDITSQYFDTEARVKTLKIQEDRLLAILEKSEKLSDVIELERRLSEVRTEIENLTGTLKRYDNLVALATVTITIREVQEITELKTKPVSFGEKVITSFRDSVKALYEIMKGLVLVIASIIPFAVVAGIIFIPVRHFIKKQDKKSKEADNSKGNDNNKEE